ncbi:EAL domain-containing protein [Sneathiella sp. P13V-1]|uniref:putative bifunctional diguanylate cyclase/phosphodiesterase n=1 Tax=Sneathiella sp. P13V-1 TaxID=2697366 RepID=UPI00187B6D25|nr:bifunctional diguanylate cyclase/phosphodiesterase [Sneathiella sp. P13V-1]MBE7638518.1 EAL domain-containing protein [Sneathiella sp. P13V-1]
MVPFGTTSLSKAANNGKASNDDSATFARADFDPRSMRPILVCQDDHTKRHLADLGINISAETSENDSSLAKLVECNQTRTIIVDYELGSRTVTNIIKKYAAQAPFLSILVVDGPHELMLYGATACIPRNDINLDNLRAALINAERVREMYLKVNPVEAATASLDRLTSLLSRDHFKQCLDKAIHEARARSEDASLIILDIDAFKGLNESKGHTFGDSVLATVAERLSQFAPEGAILGRLGDDEFAMLLQPQCLTSISDTTIAARLSHELRQPYFLDNQTTSLSATMGIAKLEEEDNAENLLHKAMSALYTAKREKSRFMVYTMQQATERRQLLKLSQELPYAIDEDQLRLHYQPMIRMHDSTVIGVEALVRWQHPSRGLLFPDSFIPLAESSGNIEPLTRWVLDAAIKQGGTWLRSGYRISVSVNISALILHNPIFPDIVNRLLEQSRFPAELLKLEITESAIISDVVRATDVVNRLHELGVKVSIDDFGTGYTSLSYIRKLPVDEIKIDKSFVLNMNTVADDAVIVRTLLELARNLDLAVVAEGVEDRETWYMLAGLGCNVAQGYYMSRPIEKETFENWLRESPWNVST